MSMNNMKVLYTNKLVGLNLKVETNEKGWYLVKLGELNNFNSKNEFYFYDNFEEVISEKNSYLSVANRIESGLLEGESTHPIKQGHTDNEFISRNLTIDSAKATHKIMSIMTKETDRTVMGKKVIEIWGWILPTDNDLGRAIKADLDNPDVNVAFSIRCFTKVVPFAGGIGRIITKIVTWDKIDIPGLKNAIKGGDRDAIINRITTESGLSDYYLTENGLEDVIKSLSTISTLATESASGIIETLKEIKKDFNQDEKSLFFKW